MPLATGGNRIASTSQIVGAIIEEGDIADNAVTPAKLSHGNEGDVLTMVSSAPAWTAPSSLPAGAILPYAGATAPTGYLLADGATVSQATYAALYALFGHTYGADPGGGNFILPNLKGRVPVGKSADTEFDTLGETGGAKTHTLDITEIPAHTHTISTGTSAGGGTAQNATSATASPSTSSAGGGGAHNNLQPYLTINYIIKT